MHTMNVQLDLATCFEYIQENESLYSISSGLQYEFKFEIESNNEWKTNEGI